MSNNTLNLLGLILFYILVTACGQSISPHVWVLGLKLRSLGLAVIALAEPYLC